MSASALSTVPSLSHEVPSFSALASTNLSRLGSVTLRSSQRSAASTTSFVVLIDIESAARGVATGECHQFPPHDPLASNISIVSEPDTLWKLTLVSEYLSEDG